jgi:hypothetical protein
MGNGRVEVFYVDADKKPHSVQAIIRGSFRGKAKRSVWIDDNSIVMVAHSGIGGSAEFEVVAVLSPDQLHDLRKEMEIDSRVVAFGIVDTAVLMSDNPLDAGVFEFEPTEEEVNIDDI